jgi:hypothetical protein
MITCAYCDYSIDNFKTYSFHLKVVHNKRLYGESLLCGQSGCLKKYMQFCYLQKHIASKHFSLCDNQYSADLHSNGNMTTNSVSSCEVDNNDMCQEHIENVIPNLSRFSVMLNKFNEDGVFKDAAEMLLLLCSKMNLSLAAVQCVKDMCHNFIESFMLAITEEVCSIFNEHNIADDRCVALLQMMKALSSPFIGLETVYQQKRYYEKNNLYIPSSQFVIGHQLEPVRTGNVVCKLKVCTGEYVSQKKVFEKLLSLPNFAQEIKAYLSKLSDDYDDFKDASLWKNHPVRMQHLNEENTLVIPVMDYYDDLEIANPLGSHAGAYKVGVKYTVIKGLPPIYNSRLDHILLNTVFVASDRKTFSDKTCLGKYIDEMNELETKGFRCIIDGREHNVFVTVVQVIGDNLALNSLLGYTESFVAAFPCRVCKMARKDFSSTFVEDESVIRTELTYEHDLGIGDVSQTGIIKESIYNKLPSFHVTKNITFDIMHDLLEGVCRYVVNFVMHYFVYDRKYFTTALLNDRLQKFSFDHSSRPTLLQDERLRKKTLNFRAVEMLNFILGLSLMIGDLVPIDDDAWELYLMLRKIVVYVCGLSFCEAEIVYLSVLITEFLQMYVETTKMNLTLKFHNMLHYPRAIRASGPMYYNWAMRCEAKHLDFKKVMTCVGNYKNVCKTLASRHQLKQAMYFASYKSISKEIVSTGVQESVLATLVNGSTVNDLLFGYGLYRQIFVCNKVEISGVTYTKNDVLVTGKDEQSLFPTFAQISTIFMTDENNCVFVCCCLNVHVLERHLQAYEVVCSEKLCILRDDQLQMLSSPWPLKTRKLMSSHKTYVSMRHK